MGIFNAKLFNIVTGEEIDILILYLVRVDFYYGLDVVKSSAG